MSKNTFFNTRFWQDSYIANLDPSEKLLFVYCITAPFLSLCGIYEVPLKFIANETGIDKDMVEKIFGRFEKDKRIGYKDGWLCVFKYPKYQSFNLPNVKKGLENEIKTIPSDILEYFVNKGYSFESIANALPSDCQYGKGTRKGNKEQGTRNKEVVDEIDADFETFWKAYPKKKGKGKAEDSWKKQKPDLAIVLAAIEREKQSKQWKEREGTFIPFPATWLNQKRWNDETEVDSNNFSKYDQ